MNKDKKDKAGKRWVIPLILTILCVLWESSIFGFGKPVLFKGCFSFVLLVIFYNWIMSWTIDHTESIPSKQALFIFVPVLTFMVVVAIFPFPYIRPWLLHVGLALGGYIFAVFAIILYFQEKELQRKCTIKTTAKVIGNISERLSKDAIYTYYPLFAYQVGTQCIECRYDHGLPRPMEEGSVVELYYNPYAPKVFCLEKSNKNYSLLGVVIMLFIATCLFVASFIIYFNHWHV